MKILKLVIIALLLISCGEEPLKPGNYRINGTVTGLDNGEIYMYNAERNVDTVKIENGTFQIDNKLEDIVGQLSLIKDPTQRGMTPNNNLGLFVEPLIMELNLDYNDLSKSKLSGSVTQDDQYRLDEIRNKIAENYKEEQAYFESVSEKYKKAAADGASADKLEAIKYEDNEARGKLASMWKEQQGAALQFIKENPKSYVSVQSIFFMLRDLQYEEAKAIVNQFNPEHLKIGYGAQLATELENMKKGIPGALAGDFSTTDINGNPLKLADFKGKYLLIDFWASWCVPCRKGNPHLIDLFNEYNSRGLEILGVSDDDRDHDAWRKAVEKDQIGIWHHVLRGLEYEEGTYKRINIHKDISEGYNISTLPTKILVGPDGVIIGRFGSGGGNDQDMDNMLAEIFENI